MNFSTRNRSQSRSLPGPHPRLGRARTGAAWFGATLGLAALACADEAASPVVLPPWVLEENVDRTLQTARADTFAAALGPTAVVGATAWSGRPVATLAEALRHLPGVMLQESFGGFEPPRLALRGSGLDSAPTARGVALLVDGLPLARADGSFHSGLFDPLLFARVEVYRGTMHAALTPAVLGGVLNAASHRSAEPAGATLRLEGGDFGQARAQFAAHGPQAGLAASFARSRGWREFSRQERHALQAGARRPLGPAAQLEATAYFARAAYDVPGPLTLADALTRPRSVTAAVLRDRPHRDSDVARLALQARAAPSAGTLAAGVAWLRLRDTFRQLQPNGESDGTSDDLTAHATLARHVALGGRQHHLLARLTGSTGVSRIERFLNDRATRGARFGAYDARARTLAVSVEDLVWLRRDLAAGAGFTALHARRALVDRFAPPGIASAVTRTVTARDLSPRAGLAWHPQPDLTFRLAASRGAEPPSFDDLVAVQGAHPQLTLRSRDVRAQRATTVEAGAQGRAGRLTWNVTAFHGRWRDEILRLADAAGLPRGAVNAGPTRHVGLESALRWRLREAPHALALGVTSTLGRFTFDDDPVYGDNRLAGAPPHVGAAELAYEHPRGAFAALEGTWVAGRTPVDHAGRLGYGGHALLHARLGWRAGDRLVVFLAARNLLDRRHLASTAGVLDLARAPAATTIFLPGPARALTLGLEWRR
jgi:iron complex outermembrane receptor protein